MITRNNDFSYEDAEIWLNGIHYPRASLQIKDGFPVEPPFPLCMAVVNLKNVAHLFRWSVRFKPDTEGKITTVEPEYLEDVFVLPRFELTEDGKREGRATYRVWRTPARASLIETRIESACACPDAIQRYEFEDRLSMMMSRYDGKGLTVCGGFTMAADMTYLSMLY